MARIDERTLNYLLACRFGPEPSFSGRLKIAAARILNRLGLSQFAAFPLDEDEDAGGLLAKVADLKPPAAPADAAAAGPVEVA